MDVINALVQFPEEAQQFLSGGTVINIGVLRPADPKAPVETYTITGTRPNGTKVKFIFDRNNLGGGKYVFRNARIN